MSRKYNGISRNSEEFKTNLRAFQPTEYERLLLTCPIRSLREEERLLVTAVAKVASLDQALVSSAALDAVRVRDMPDGGMGSLRFLSLIGETDRSFGRA